MRARFLRRAGAMLAATTTIVTGLTEPYALAAPAGAASPAGATYSNPLPLALPDGSDAINCADPYVAHAGARWYLYCTTDVIDATSTQFAIVPSYYSSDLVHWTYAGQALPSIPSWVGGGSMWAPDLVHRNGRFYLYYTASDTPSGTSSTGGGSAIGVLVGNTPLGPWHDSGGPVVAPMDSPYSPGTQRNVIDPEVVVAHGVPYLYFGSFSGGVSVRRLSSDGLHSDPASERQITIDNRYEGTSIVRHDGWYYLIASATNCCNGRLTGYTVFAGRSRSVLGPFVDRDGRSLLATRVGGTPVLAQNGNRWVGPGHDAVITDFAGQDWMFYHAVDRNDPYVPGQTGYTKRPLLLDALDWRDGWPVVRGGHGPSDSPQPVPAAQPGTTTAYRPHFIAPPRLGSLDRDRSDGFSGTALASRWQWVREPSPRTYGVGNGAFHLDTQNGDLQPPTQPLASVLTEPAPTGNYAVTTRVRVSVPNDGSVHNYVQGGLVVRRDDGNYLKLTVSSIWDTRQTEFGKHESPVPAGYSSYGNGVDGPAGSWTWLRIVRAGERYTAFTSLDGKHWDRGGTWTLTGATAIGLVSMGGLGYRTRFDFVRVRSA